MSLTAPRSSPSPHPSDDPHAGLRAREPDAGRGHETPCDDAPAFSYAGAPKGQSYEEWREVFCQRFCQMDAKPLAADRIDCTIEVTQVGMLSFGAAHGSACSFLRTRSLLTDGCDDLSLVTATEGKVLAIQRGRRIELHQGEMCLMSLDDIAESALSDGGRLNALRIPRRELVGLCRDAEDTLYQPLNGNPHLREMVAAYFSLCARTGPVLDATGQHTMARHMTELVALLLRAETGAVPEELRGGYGGARLQLVKAHALQCLSDGDLSILSVARHAGTTPKQVQRLFEASGSTFSEFVLEQRLQLALRLLSQPQARRAKISAVAHEAGFGDLSYFNRSFRRRFGMTPSEWRRTDSAIAAGPAESCVLVAGAGHAEN